MTHIWTNLAIFGHFLALLGSKCSKMAKNGIWRALKLERLEQVEEMLEQDSHRQDWSLWPLFGTKIGQLWCPEGPKMIQKWSINASRRALEPRMAGTSWNKCWNRITIRTNDYDPFLAHKRPIVVPRRSKNGPSECNVGLFWAIYCHFWTFWAVMHKCPSRQTMLASAGLQDIWGPKIQILSAYTSP